MITLNLSANQAERIVGMYHRWLEVKNDVEDSAQGKALLSKYISTQYKYLLDAIYLDISNIMTSLALVKATEVSKFQTATNNSISLDTVSAVRLHKFVQLCVALDIDRPKCIAIKGEKGDKPDVE